MNLKILASYLLGSAVLATASISELQVETSSGIVHGFYNNSAETVRTFLGIPYAEPPVGQRRFAPAVRKGRMQGVFDASSFGPPCPGQFSFSNESIWTVLPYNPWNTADMSEDCLSINVWAPAAKHKKAKGKKAVMMYIYGGGFVQGGTALTFYDGSNLVQDNEDIIVVTFNYRVTVLGYPNSPDLPWGQQNVGLLDQRLAVQWVHDNIEKFGGDPSRIMLFGQSAGAASVDMYTYAYPDNPLVNAVAIESGAADIITSADSTHQNWDKLSTALGCGSGRGTLRCMQMIPFRQILAELSRGSYNFAPLQDNVTVFADYPARAKKGKCARVPALIGNNAREGAAFFDLSSASINETAIFAATQTTFNCPVQHSALLKIEQGIPTWRYLYHGNWSNLSPVPWLGAYHSGEVPIVFGTYNMSPLGIPSTPREVEASQYIQGAWVAFAKDPHNGLRKYGWPNYNPHGNTLINLALNNSVAPVFTSPKGWDSHCNESVFVP
ncbi:acetylcholinesterase [Aspergillus udagawae]|nr:acetylcholinesterase [Aspergillus udagawae]